MVAIISNFLSVEQIFLFDVCISREMATNRKMDNNPHLSILLLSMIYFHRKFSIKWRLIKLFLNILSILFTIPDKTFKISTKLFILFIYNRTICLNAINILLPDSWWSQQIHILQQNKRMEETFISLSPSKYWTKIRSSLMKYRPHTCK